MFPPRVKSPEQGDWTHVPTTGQIALFRFTHETGAAAGVRRIEAVTGPGAYELVRRLEEQLAQAAGVLKTQPEHLVKRIETLVEENKRLQKGLAEALTRTTATSDNGQQLQIGNILVVLVDTELQDSKLIGA